MRNAHHHFPLINERFKVILNRSDAPYGIEPIKFLGIIYSWNGRNLCVTVSKMVGHMILDCKFYVSSKSHRLTRFETFDWRPRSNESFASEKPFNFDWTVEPFHALVSWLTHIFIQKPLVNCCEQFYLEKVFTFHSMSTKIRLAEMLWNVIEIKM